MVSGAAASDGTAGSLWFEAILLPLGARTAQGGRRPPERGAPRAPAEPPERLSGD